MAFINNKKFLEIKKSAKDGNEKALKILEELKKNAKQDRINKLIENFYNLEEPQDKVVFDLIKDEKEAIDGYAEGKEKIDNSNIENKEAVKNIFDHIEDEEKEHIEELENAQDIANGNEFASEPVVEDLTDTLDKELDGILDEIEIKDISFCDFLKDKKKNGNRMRKDNTYFKAFNPKSKEAYIIKKKNDYAKKFESKLEDIERNYRDIDISLDEYLNRLDDMLDDNIELDMAVVGNAYNDIIDNENTMKKFNRYWDWKDSEDMNNVLKELVEKYGKRNVQSALNTIKSDNDNHHSYKKDQVIEEISRYNKVLEKLLK